MSATETQRGETIRRSDHAKTIKQPKAAASTQQRFLQPGRNIAARNMTVLKQVRAFMETRSPQHQKYWSRTRSV